MTGKYENGIVSEIEIIRKEADKDVNKAYRHVRTLMFDLFNSLPERQAIEPFISCLKILSTALGCEETQSILMERAKDEWDAKVFLKSDIKTH